jgi:hypothetical protein
LPNHQANQLQKDKLSLIIQDLDNQEDHRTQSHHPFHEQLTVASTTPSFPFHQPELQPTQTKASPISPKWQQHDQILSPLLSNLATSE